MADSIHTCVRVGCSDWLHLRIVLYCCIVLYCISFLATVDVLHVEFGLLSNTGERVAIVQRHPGFFPPVCLCFCVHLRQRLFSREFWQGQLLVAVGSFTCAKCMMQTGPGFIVSSEGLLRRPPLRV